MIFGSKKILTLLTVTCCASPLMGAVIWNGTGIIPPGEADNDELHILGGYEVKAESNESIKGIEVASGGTYKVISNDDNKQQNIVIDLSVSDGSEVDAIHIHGLHEKANIHIGDGSTLKVTGTDNGPGEIYGLRLGSNSRAKADNLNIELLGGKNTRMVTGIHITGANESIVVLGGEKNTIHIDGPSDAAIFLLAQDEGVSKLKAHNLTIKTQGSGLNDGIDVKDNSIVQLTGTTEIFSEGAAISADRNGYVRHSKAGVVEAERINVFTTATTPDRGALHAQDSGRIIVGDGSKITTINMHGIYATDLDSFVSYKGSESARNSIDVSGKFGVYVEYGKVELEHTDIIARGVNNNSIGLLALGVDGAEGIIDAKNTTIKLADERYQTAGALALGSSEINFSGRTKIDTSDTEGRVALEASIGGAITVRDQATIVGDIYSNDGGSVLLDLANGSLLMGNTQKENGTINMRFNEGSRWIMTEDDSSLTSVTLERGSALYLQSPKNFNNNNTFKPVERTITGNFIGGGTLYFNTVLGADDSATDRLTIKGDVEGQSLVVVNNIGGRGAETLEGIKLITVEGNVAEGDQTFKKFGRIVAGAYEYELLSRDNTWYLSSALCTDECSSYLPPEIEPEIPEEEIVLPPAPPIPPFPDNNRVRAEAGSYLNNQMMANNLFIMNLADREMGEFAYLRGAKNFNKPHELWIRMTGGHYKFRDQSEQLSTSSDYYALQFGGLIYEWNNDSRHNYRIGVMGAIGNGNGTTNGKYSTKGSVNRSHSHLVGQALGIYFTYYANEEDRQGAYLDTWLQHNWFQNRVEGDGNPTEKYHSKGFTASLESGFSLRLNKVTEESPYQWYLQPHIQLTYLGVRMKGHREVNGTYVRSENNNNAQFKLGLRFALSPYETVQPYDIKGYFDVSWINNSNNFGVSLDQTNIESKGAKNIGEVKLGVEGTINENINLWGNIAFSKGSNRYQDTKVVLGLKYRFNY